MVPTIVRLRGLCCRQRLKNRAMDTGACELRLIVPEITHHVSGATLSCPHSWKETETKQFWNSFETVLFQPEQNDPAVTVLFQFHTFCENFF